MTPAEKAEALIRWFDKLEFDEEQFTPNDFSLITDFTQFVDTSKAVLGHYPVMGAVWKAAYMRLWNLKKAIEDYEITRNL